MFYIYIQDMAEAIFHDLRTDKQWTLTMCLQDRKFWTNCFYNILNDSVNFIGELIWFAKIALFSWESCAMLAEQRQIDGIRSLPPPSPFFFFFLFIFVPFFVFKFSAFQRCCISKTGFLCLCVRVSWGT